MTRLTKRITAAAAVAASLIISGEASAGLLLMTDLWNNPNEAGWGANVVEQEGVMFITFFVYGPDGRPTWYVGSNTVQDASSLTWSGPLYATTGSYFGAQFDPNATNVRQVGTVRFDASCNGCNTYSNAQITYTVDGVTTTKNVRRFAYKAMAIPSQSLGHVSARSGNTCAIPDNAAATITYTSGNGRLAIADSAGNSYVITMSSISQYGMQYIGNPPATLNGAGVGGTGFAMTVDYSVLYGTLRGTGSNGCTLRVQFGGMS